MSKVQCVECGYLAVRYRDTSQLAEATKSTRDTGMFERREVFPECAVMAASIKGECHDSPKNFLRVVAAERDCREYVNWMPGFSPKEHLQMNIVQKEREQQRAFQQEMATIQIQIAEDERTWRKEQAQRDKEWRKEDRSSDWFRLCIGVVIGIISSIATLVAADKFPWVGVDTPP